MGHPLTVCCAICGARFDAVAWSHLRFVALDRPNNVEVRKCAGRIGDAECRAVIHAPMPVAYRPAVIDYEAHGEDQL